MTEPIRVVIAEDQAMVLGALAALAGVVHRRLRVDGDARISRRVLGQRLAKRQ